MVDIKALAKEYAEKTKTKEEAFIDGFKVACGYCLGEDLFIAQRHFELVRALKEVK